MIVFSEIKRCQLPHSTQFFQKAEVEEETAAAEAEVRLLKSAAAGSTAICERRLRRRWPSASPPFLLLEKIEWSAEVDNGLSR